MFGKTWEQVQKLEKGIRDSGNTSVMMGALCQRNNKCDDG